MSITISAVGNLGRDPEISHGQDGRRRAHFSLACSRKRQGEEQTTWLRCTVFQEGLVGVVESFVTKGRQVFISGEFTLRPYTANDGTEKLSADVIVDRLTLCGARPEHAGESRNGQRHGVASDDQVRDAPLDPKQVQAAINAQAPPGKRAVPRYAELDDAIPF
jgi:single-strand DNA-binding protein